MDSWDMYAATWSHILAEAGVVCAGYSTKVTVGSVPSGSEAVIRF